MARQAKHEQPILETMLEAARQFADPQMAHDFFRPGLLAERGCLPVSEMRAGP